MTFKRLGEFIQRVNKKNTDLNVSKLLGVSINKKFIDSIANTDNIDFKNYNIIEKNQFAYSPVTSRNGNKITIALLDNYDEAILSPMYKVFEVKDKSKVLPEFIFLFFQRTEFDRYARFNSWGTARETFDWEDLCNVLLPIPSLNEQKKYVDMYTGLIKNQKVYETSLVDLKFICNQFIQNLIKKEKNKILGKYIEKSEEVNSNLELSFVRGISINKKFIETKAKMDGVSLAKYRIVRKGQFSFNPNTARMGDKIPIALNEGKDCLVSQIYPVFKIIDEKTLLPEFLFLFFNRPEFDRYARYHSWGSARETFDWDDMCNVKIPIPDIKIQESIVTIYNTLNTRNRLNQILKDKLKPLSPVLIRGVIEKYQKLQKV